jgi:regulator of replication initiation timing
MAEREQKITDIDLQMATLRDQKVQFEVQYKAAKEKLNSLMTQNEALVKENAQLKAQLGNIQSQPTTSPRTVPPEDARGTVKTVQNELATITIGTDAGINVGNVLQVYRVRPQPEYLGTLTILAATPHEAVGRLSGPKRNQVRVGDEVAARVLPN